MKHGLAFTRDYPDIRVLTAAGRFVFQTGEYLN